jgi:hypothetical protein
MIMTYVNYPVKHITIHRNPNCGSILQRKKLTPRIVTVTPATLGKVLTDFAANKVDFGSNSAVNDLWLDISLSTLTQEESVVHIVHALLSRRYPKRFGSIVPKPHDCK